MHIDGGTTPALQRIEIGITLFIQGHDLAIQDKGLGPQIHECEEQIGKLGEGFAASGIQLHLVALFGGDATIAVELYFVLPLPPAREPATSRTSLVPSAQRTSTHLSGVLIGLRCLSA